MSEQTLTLELSNALALSEAELVRRGMLALVEKEIRLAELEIANIRERYDVFSKEALYQAIKDGHVVAHPAWEDYIVWKNKEAYDDYAYHWEQRRQRGRIYRWDNAPHHPSQHLS